MGSQSDIAQIESRIKQWQDNLAIARRDGNKSNVARAQDMIKSLKEDLKRAKAAAKKR